MGKKKPLEHAPSETIDGEVISRYQMRSAFYVDGIRYDPESVQGHSDQAVIALKCAGHYLGCGCHDEAEVEHTAELRDWEPADWYIMLNNACQNTGTRPEWATNDEEEAA